MTDTSPKPTLPAPLEFELIDLTEARLALHQVPEGLRIADNLRPEKWISKRRPKLPTDRALLGDTMVWLSTLDPCVRPVQLADRTPRLANALAKMWSDPEEVASYIDELLVDKRGGRQGLPTALREELLRLRRIVVAAAREIRDAAEVR